MFYMAQAATSLQSVQTTGTVTTLTLPSGVTISSTRRGRFVVFNQQIFFVNAPSINLWIDPFDLTVRPMGLRPPINPPTLAAGSGTGLTGVYRGQVAYYVKNAAGEVVNLSPLSPLSLATSSLANKDITWSDIPISPDASQFVSATSPYVFGRRLFRTLAGGTDTFEMLDIDDNSTTTLVSSLPDASLSLLPSSVDIGIPPGSIPGTALSLICSWKDRLWAVSAKTDEVDFILFTEIDQFYAFAPDNLLKAKPIGADAFGVTGFLPRRDFLGVGKRDRLLKIIGNDLTDLEVVIVAEKVSCVAPESCVVIRDVGYFLGLDGVYRWDDDGVVNISRGQVDPWFTSDTYFNRARFPNAYAGWNPVTNTYDLHLAAAGSSVEDRWVSFHVDKQEWLGPHKTAAFTPTVAALLENAGSALLPSMAGADGYIYLQNQVTPSDIPGGGLANAIDAFLQTRFHAGAEDAAAPDVEHYFGQLSVLSRIESDGDLVITPYVGGVDASAGTTLSADLTLGRERLGRLGVGRLAALKFSQAVAGRRFLLYGYEIDPIFEVGKR